MTGGLRRVLPRVARRRGRAGGRHLAQRCLALYSVVWFPEMSKSRSLVRVRWNGLPTKTWD